MRMCDRGCNEEYEYIGVGDGYGIHGDCFCDVYRCPACGDEATVHCECDDNDTIEREDGLLWE